MICCTLLFEKSVSFLLKLLRHSHLGRVALLDDPGNERELEYVFCWGALVDGSIQWLGHRDSTHPKLEGWEIMWIVC